jgi:hypothetical protein
MRVSEQQFQGQFHKTEFSSELGLVMGYAIVCTDTALGKDSRYFDLHGDHITEDCMFKAAVDFMLEGGAGKVMHSGEQVGKVVFAMPLTAETKKALSLDGPLTGLAIAWKPLDDEVLKLFKDGILKGFSIGGDYGETEELPDG